MGQVHVRVTWSRGEHGRHKAHGGAQEPLALSVRVTRTRLRSVGDPTVVSRPRAGTRIKPSAKRLTRRKIKMMFAPCDRASSIHTSKLPKLPRVTHKQHLLRAIQSLTSLIGGLRRSRSSVHETKREDGDEKASRRRSSRGAVSCEEDAERADSHSSQRNRVERVALLEEHGRRTRSGRRDLRRRDGTTERGERATWRGSTEHVCVRGAAKGQQKEGKLHRVGG